MNYKAALVKIFIILISGLTITGIYVIGKDLFKKRKQYFVKVHFCDDRPDMTMLVRSKTYPSSNDIENGPYQAMTRYEGFVNVCEVSVIKELEQ